MSQPDQEPCIQKRIRTWFSNLKPEYTILRIVLVGTVSVYFIFYIFYPATIFFSFLTSWSAGFLGILLGFALDRWIEQIKDNRVNKDFRSLIRDELTDIRGKIYPQTESVFMLYPEIWDSLISSGVIRLLSSEQVTKLSKVYKFIKGTQYEAEWVRRAIEEFNNTPESEKERRQWLENRYRGLWDRHNERGKKLSKEIDEILKEKWWN